jgi:tRNA(fMet)-specific endonuclease VapC
VDGVALDAVVADTDVCIDFLRGAAPGADAIEDWLRSGRLRITAITAFELRLGADFETRAATMAALLRPRTIPLDLHAALLAGHVASALRTQGRSIGMADTLVAGVCLSRDLPLATRNEKHFGRVEGLRLRSIDPR